MKKLIATIILAASMVLVGCKESPATKTQTKQTVTYSITNVCPHITMSMGEAREDGFKLERNAVFAAEDQVCLTKNIKGNSGILPYIDAPSSDINLIYKSDGTLVHVAYTYFIANETIKEDVLYNVIGLFRKLYGKPIVVGGDYTFRYGYNYISVNDNSDFISLHFSDLRKNKD